MSGRLLPASLACEVSAWRLEGSDGAWRAVATTHVFDFEHVPPRLTPETAVLAGAVIRVVSAEATEDFPALAMALAVQALIDKLRRDGLR